MHTESRAGLRDGLTTIISGEINRIHGRSERRLRFWIRLTTQLEQGVGAVPGGWCQNERQQNEKAGEIVWVLFDAKKAGDVVQARAKDVVAIGYVVRFLVVQPGPEGAR